ncbi:Protein of unknown function [Gryllus bimaculatus]|nr:Protein of unknown function [Gryllus bimaculatus]
MGRAPSPGTAVGTLIRSWRVLQQTSSPSSSTPVRQMSRHPLRGARPARTKRRRMLLSAEWLHGAASRHARARVS